MVAAREAFLGGGHFAAIAGAVRAAAAGVAVDRSPRRAGCVVELGCGTGYHLAAVLAGLAGWHGLALDSSRAGLRRAVRADPRIAAVVCDAWGPLPVGDAAADVVLSVFAPRNPPELARILAPEGRVIVVTPGPDHLRELVSTLGMIGVDPDKPARLQAKLSPELRPVGASALEFELTLDRPAVLALAAMGPSAHHIDPAELRERVALLPRAAVVTASVRIDTFAHR
jgi:23S rRNA (guanine745-N1)-methyltransferase